MLYDENRECLIVLLFRMFTTFDIRFAASSRIAPTWS